MQKKIKFRKKYLQNVLSEAHPELVDAVLRHMNAEFYTSANLVP